MRTDEKRAQFLLLLWCCNAYVNKDVLACIINSVETTAPYLILKLLKPPNDQLNEKFTVKPVVHKLLHAMIEKYLFSK